MRIKIIISELVSIIFIAHQCVCERTSHLCAQEKVVQHESQNRVLEKAIIFVSIFVRNKESSLPYFLSYFQQLNYPKNRIILYIRADHCEDNSIEIVDDWLEEVGHEYYHVDAVLDRTSSRFDNQTEFPLVNREILEFIVNLKEKALNKARSLNVDYALFLDADVYLTNPDVLNHLIQHNYTISAPMLITTGSNSNFWGAMTEHFWYKRSDDYFDIRQLKQVGCKDVALVHSCVLINLWGKSTDMITFNASKIGNHKVPFDDLVAFGVSVAKAKLKSYVCNDENYGFLDGYLDVGDTLAKNAQNLNSLKRHVARHYQPLKTTKYLERYLPRVSVDKAGLDKIYFINLNRRTERKEWMELLLREIGLEAVRFEAVDGRTLNLTNLEMDGVRVLEGYTDPCTGSEITLGEIGCFLSHYRIWTDVIKRGYDSVSQK